MSYYWHEVKVLFKNFYEDFTDLVVNLYENVIIVLDNTFIHFPKHISFFIKRMIELVPVAWNDVDYDWNSVLIFMKFKISKIRKYLEKNKEIQNSKKYIKEMEKAENLIDIAMDEHYYNNEYLGPIEEKYGKNIFFVEEGDDNKKALRVLIKREKWTEELDKEIKREERKAYNKAIKKYENQWNKLWQHLDKCLRWWWS